ASPTEERRPLSGSSRAELPGLFGVGNPVFLEPMENRLRPGLARRGRRVDPVVNSRHVLYVNKTIGIVENARARALFDDLHEAVLPAVPQRDRDPKTGPVCDDRDDLPDRALPLLWLGNAKLVGPEGHHDEVGVVAPDVLLELLVPGPVS